MTSVPENRQAWNSYDWSQQGDEWSESWGSTVQLWNGTVMPRIARCLPAEHVLEIGPGGGRCTQFLVSQARRLTLVDLSAECIARCKQRFGEPARIAYVVNDGKSLEAVDDSSVDFAFSWDSLVHVELDVMEAYLSGLAQKLKPGSCAFLHHSNVGAFAAKVSHIPAEDLHWRARSVSAEDIQAACERAGMECLAQERLSWGGGALTDCFSLLRRPKDAAARVRPQVVTHLAFHSEVAHLSRRHALYNPNAQHTRPARETWLEVGSSPYAPLGYRLTDWLSRVWGRF
jgi:2-polyprenyl-3-methyl-5-hydroxy-6-metoxy-1,4-benzoquinol methylase